MLSQLLTVAACVAVCLAYPQGPPIADHPGLCQSMSPLEGHNVSATTDDSYFEIIISPDCYKDGLTISGTVKVTDANLEDDNKYFEGVFVQARKIGDDTMSYGTFSTTQNKINAINCFTGQTNNALAQSDKEHFKEVAFKWTSPANFTDDIEFVATIVHETDKYWLGLKSAVIKSKDDCKPETSAATMPETRILPAIFAGVLTLILAVVLP